MIFIEILQRRYGDSSVFGRIVHVFHKKSIIITINKVTW